MKKGFKKLLCSILSALTLVTFNATGVVGASNVPTKSITNFKVEEKNDFLEIDGVTYQYRKFKSENGEIVVELSTTNTTEVYRYNPNTDEFYMNNTNISNQISCIDNSRSNNIVQISSDYCPIPEGGWILMDSHLQEISIAKGLGGVAVTAYLISKFNLQEKLASFAGPHFAAAAAAVVTTLPGALILMSYRVNNYRDNNYLHPAWKNEIVLYADRYGSDYLASSAICVRR